MELHGHTPYVAPSWLLICFVFLVLVPAASTQSSFGFLQPLPTPVQCENYAFAWTSGGTPPYNLIVSVNGNWGRAYGISGLEGQGVPWMIPVPAGYAVSFELFDNASHVATAGPLTIQSSSDDSCLSSAVPSSSSPKSTIIPPPTTSSSSSAASSPAPFTDPTTSVLPTSEAPSSQPPSSSSSSSLTSSSSPTPSSSSTATTSSSSAAPFTSSTLSTSRVSSTSDGIVSTILVTAPPAAATNANSPSTTPHRATFSTGAIAGVAVGGAAVLVLAGLTIWFCRRHKRRSYHAGVETSTADPGTIAKIHTGHPQMSETVASDPARRPRPLPTPSSSPGSSDGSHQLLLHSDSEGSVSGSSRLQPDGAAQSSGSSFLSPSPSPRDRAQRLPLTVHDENTKSTSLKGPEIATPPIPTVTPDDKPDLPSHPSRGMSQGYAAVPTDGRSASEVGTRAPSMRFEVDGGVRLAGGLPGEVLDDAGDVNDSGRWVVQPPPYQRFR